MPTALPADSAERARRAIVLQLRAAAHLLTPARGSADTDVHEARKGIKRARAMLRLLRPSLVPRAFRETNRRLRDAGRALSSARDAKVLGDTLAGVVAREHVSPARARRLRARIQPTRAHAPGTSGLPAEEAALACSLLQRACRRIERLTLADDAAERLEEGLERIRRRGRRAMERAREAATVEALHEWRKQVKNYWHALEALPTRGTRRVRERITTARALSKLLGDDHDLAMLDARLRESAAAGRGDRELRASIERRRRRLQKRAFDRGAELYSGGTRRIAQR